MDTRLYGIDQSKRYGVELYGSDGLLIWKAGSDDPITPMQVGEEIQALDARNARPDLFYVITSIRHLLWTASGQLRSTTRIHARLGVPAD